MLPMLHTWNFLRKGRKMGKEELKPKIKNTEVRAEFEKMSENELSDPKFLTKFIYDKVGIAVNAIKCGIKNYRDLSCWGGLCIKQYPDEMGKFLAFLYPQREKIQSFCEIGSEFGGTFYLIDSFLRAVNPNMKHSLTIDRRNVINYYTAYHRANPLAEFRRIDSQQFTPEHKYDLVFIDGDHEYKSVKHDYENMYKCAKIIALHDIKLVQRNKEGAKRLWEELEDDSKIELLNEDPRFELPVGIGVIMVKQ